MTGRFELPNTRSQGRKVDTWSFKQPDDEAVIDVFFHAKYDRVYFTASSKHASLANKKWQDTDIERLSKTVKDEVSEIFHILNSDRWRPSLILDVDPDLTDRPHERNFKLSVKVTPASLDMQTPRKNDGSLRIAKDGSLTSVKERTPSDDSHISHGDKRIKMDSEGSRIVIADTAQTREATLALQATLERFGRLLAQRVSPARANPEDIPSPADLVEMMKKAAGDADA